MSRLAVIAAFALLPLSVPAAAATLTGVQFDVSYRYPTQGTVYDSAIFTPATFTVGPGQETVGDVEGVTQLLVDFAASSLRLTFQTVLTGPRWSDTSFNGPIFVAAAPLGLTSATINAASTFGNFDASRVSFSGNTIALDFAGLDYSNGTLLAIDFGTVPEPGVWVMMITGFGLAGVATRRRRRVLAGA